MGAHFVVLSTHGHVYWLAGSTSAAGCLVLALTSASYMACTELDMPDGMTDAQWDTPSGMPGEMPEGHLGGDAVSQSVHIALRSTMTLKQQPDGRPDGMIDRNLGDVQLF